MDKLISVIIPTYKRPKYLLRCLRSLLLQTCNKSDFEVIVVSDGADYSIELLVDSFNQNGFTFKYNFLDKKAGPAAARNIGWKTATSNLIAFTNDDCLPDKDWLKNLLANYNNEELIAYSGKLIVPISATPTDYEKNTSNLAAASFITANCCCTKKALEKVGGFDERFSLAWREDSDLEFKFILNEIPIVKNNDAIVTHPVRKVPWGISIKEQKKGIYNALLYKKYPELYRKYIQPSPAWDYYLMLLLLIGVLVGISINLYITAICGILYLIFLFNLVNKRLVNTSRSFKHVTEMVYTSILIPFVSIYWQLSGALKYKVFFL